MTPQTNPPQNASTPDPDIRWHKVNDVRAQIAVGTYETDDKLDAALAGLLTELGG